jgi:hypothetical protein
MIVEAVVDGVELSTVDGDSAFHLSKTSRVPLG